MTALRVLHLAGSAVSDFHADLSLTYARGCLAATADPQRYEAHPAVVSPDGRWRFPASFDADVIAAATPFEPADALAHLGVLGLDVVLPQMFCRPGMTSYRSLFEVLGVPVVGNTGEVMAIGARKAAAKAMVAAAGVDVPAGEVLRRGDRPTVAPPAVVKPADADNSLGVTLVRTADGFPGALHDAFAHSSEVLVEEFVPLGREVRCGLVERDGELVGLPLEEYLLDGTTRPVRSYDDKLAPSDTGLRLVAKDDPDVVIVDPEDPVTARVWDAARRCHVALGCRDHSLFDFRIDPTGRPVFLEASLYCSFAPSSVLAVMAAAGGIALDELLATAVTGALKRR
ncbi:D-alanine--D-alanine ligase family protein [Actinomycetospora callitridis]|uniref:D-alanine--D-alanine ligase family protein n=1 Tax=Actinomycetospora callitridis TaxID=913944 RepID=UPI0023669F13|nr:D-alanine--D-alanine ligase [Actinomycetospora callitridis]MDD7916206.1 D-alanine--D-alanine ligase [Actinomycetospora callitridis]